MVYNKKGVKISKTLLKVFTLMLAVFMSLSLVGATTYHVDDDGNLVLKEIKPIKRTKK